MLFFHLNSDVSEFETPRPTLKPDPAPLSPILDGIYECFNIWKLLIISKNYSARRDGIKNASSSADDF